MKKSKVKLVSSRLQLKEIARLKVESILYKVTLTIAMTYAIIATILLKSL
jgi:hypothetical protein